MSDYIKREDAINIKDYLKRFGCFGDYGFVEIEGVLIALNKVPSADVAPVVRCKDCRHAVDYYHEGDCYCSNPKWGLNYFGGSWEFYCADAERRNNE